MCKGYFQLKYVSWLTYSCLMELKPKGMIELSNMTRDERIKYRRNKLKLSPSYVAKCVGVSRVTYINWEEGKVTDIAWPKFNRLADVLLTTPDWLEYGAAIEKYVHNGADGEITKALSGIHIIKSTSIPVYHVGDAGIDLSKETNEYVDMPAKSSSIFALKIGLDNVICRAHAGDALILDGNTEPVPGEEVYIEFLNGSSNIYVFNYKRDGQVNCSNNQNKVIFEEKEIKKMVAIVAVARNSYIKKRS